MPSAFKAFVSNVQELTDSRVTFRDAANEKCYNALVYDPSISVALDQASLGLAPTTLFHFCSAFGNGQKNDHLIQRGCKHSNIREVKKVKNH